MGDSPKSEKGAHLTYAPRSQPARISTVTFGWAAQGTLVRGPARPRFVELESLCLIESRRLLPQSEARQVPSAVRQPQMANPK